MAALALGFVPFAPSLAVMAIAVFFFYLGYFSYFAPYQALYADLVPAAATGRAQGIQGVFSELGLGGALVGGAFRSTFGGPCRTSSPPRPSSSTTTALVLGLGASQRRPAIAEPTRRSPRSAASEVWALVRDDRRIRSFAVGNALLMLGLGGLKSFVVLWLTEGLGKTMRFTGFAMAIVAIGATAGALVGQARRPIRRRARSVNRAHLLRPRARPRHVLELHRSLGRRVSVIALSAGAALALPYALLMQLRPSGSHGIVAGLYDVSSGVGTLLGPAVTGAAMNLMRPWFAATHGFAAMWPVLSISVVAAAVVLRRASESPGAAPARQTAR